MRLRQLPFALLTAALLAHGPAALAQQVQISVPGNVVYEPGRDLGEELGKGVVLMQQGQPAEAEKIFSKIIKAYEKNHDPAVPYRCSYPEDAQRTVDHAVKQLGDKRFILGSDVWCAALWGKGFVLIDLGRSSEAGEYLARSVEMMPFSAHFINEYAEWYKPQRDWKKSYALFERAWQTVDRDVKGRDRKIAARALRGMAFNLIELGDLDQAEHFLKLSLEYEPEAAAKVRGELDYIAEQRAKK